MYSRDRYEIIGLCKISHFLKQPCRNVCVEKSVINASKLLKQHSTFVKESGKSFFDLQQAFKISSLAQIFSASEPACLQACCKTG